MPGGRVALVTGGSRGIGRACALALAEDGFDIALNYRRNTEAAAEAVAAVEARGRRARAYRASVEVPAEDEAMVAAVQEDFGPVDTLVHAAGIASRGHTVADTDPAELEHVVAVHAFGAHHLCRLVLPSMRAAPRGDIVMVSSVVTRLLGANGAPYNMAKAALEALALTLAKEERRHGIHVNVVAPSLVVTEMGRRIMQAMGVEDIESMDARAPFGRVCRPEDVAGVVRFLCSPGAGYLSGEVIAVDGGG
ncbi:MAG TPA: SDR family oxidoreductase [Acidimicrobiales bacterium]|nr:SDR family oxidoreductase [Acidimicrobiales bacterium]